MAREQFSHPAAESLFKKLEPLSQRSGVSRGVAFEDWLTAMVCALAAETKEAEYLAMIERHKVGATGKRGYDLMGQMVGDLVTSMDKSESDILADLFQGAITYGEAGQYFTPESVTKLMAQMTIDLDARPADGRPVLINDPCCGTGRMLLDAATINPCAEFVGQDIDARCAKITAINLGLRGRYGWVICGNSLSGETHFAYRIGSFFNETPNGLRRGVIRDVPPEQTPVPLLASRSRGDIANLITAESVLGIAGKVSTSAIVEVPRWLASLETALTGQDPTPSTSQRPSAEPASYDNDAAPRPTFETNDAAPCAELPPSSQLHLF